LRTGLSVTGQSTLERRVGRRTNTGLGEHSQRSSLLVGSMIRVNTNARNTSSPPAAERVIGPAQRVHRCPALEPTISSGPAAARCPPQVEHGLTTAIRSAAAAFNAARSPSVVRPAQMLDLPRGPHDLHRRGPEVVLTVRTYATSARLRTA